MKHFVMHILSMFGSFVQCPYVSEEKLRRGITAHYYCRKKKWHFGPHTDFTADTRSRGVKWRDSGVRRGKV